jgi:hypothetical protein
MRAPKDYSSHVYRMEITDNKRSFFLQRHYAIPVEIIINVEDPVRKYIHIGDILYAYGTMKPVEQRLVVTEEEYTFIDDIYRRVCIRDSVRRDYKII